MTTPYGREMLPGRSLVLALTFAAMSAACALPVSGQVVEPAHAETAKLVVDRLDGVDRYATSVRISREAFPAGADNVFVATGQSFPDALATGPAASVLNAPILLTGASQLPAEVRAELQRLDPSTIYLVGGPAAISRDVESNVAGATTAQVRRIAGNDRYSTAAAVTELAFASASVVYVAAGTGFADALSAGSPGGLNRRPVLLTEGGALSPPSRAQIIRLGNPNVIVLGGPAVVSSAVMAELDAVTTGSVRRVSGANRYSTSVAVSADAFPSADTVFLATGTAFPDALSAAPAAARLGAPILLSTPTCVPGETISEVARLGADRVIAVGGQKAISDAAAALTPCSAKPPSDSSLFATSVDTVTKQIEDQNGDPWFGVGDSAWSLVGQLSRSDITTYLEGIAAEGFNLILFSAPEAYYTDNDPPYRNDSGDLPFTGRAFESGLNDRYWNVVDHAVSEAARLGITCIIVPQYSGFADGGDGWSLDVEAAYDSDPQHLVRYGTELAMRYASYPNIVWMVGHDRIPTAKFKAASRLIALELQSGTNHMVIQGGWNDGGRASTGDTDWNGVAGPDITTDFDTVYVYDRSIAAETAKAWASKAAIFLEGVYEQEVPGPLPIGDQLLRAQMWEAFSTGASAAFLGNNPRWHFGSGGLGTGHSGTWQQSITTDPFNKGTVHAGYMADFMSTIEGALLTVPDTRSTFITAGSAHGRFNQSLGVAYAAGAGSITLDTTELAGTGAVRIRRFDPTDGSSTAVTLSEAQASSRVVGYPGPNSAGGTDYVYVIDLAS